MQPVEKARPVKHHIEEPKKDPIGVSMMGHKVGEKKSGGMLSALFGGESKTMGPKTVGVLSLNAEEMVDETTRQGMDIIAVLDVSSSMNGSKINLLRETMHFVADVLTEQDRLSIVSFSSNANRLTPLIPLGKANKTRVDAAIRGLNASGSTNISSGMA